jgi:hypothetical protein
MSTKSKIYKGYVQGMNPGATLPDHTVSTALPSSWGPDHNPIDASVVFRRGSALASAILLNSLSEPLQYINDPMMERRFKLRIRKLNFSNFWNRRCPRCEFEERMKKLVGFQFNDQSLLETIVTAAFTSAINIEKGRAKFSIPFFIPFRDITWPRGSKICRIKTTITGVDLDTGDFKTIASYSPQFSKKMKTSTSYESITDLPSPNYPLLIYCCGIDFFTSYGKNHLVKLADAKYNPMDIVAVEFKAGKIAD